MKKIILTSICLAAVVLCIAQGQRTQPLKNDNTITLITDKYSKAEAISVIIENLIEENIMVADYDTLIGKIVTEPATLKGQYMYQIKSQLKKDKETGCYNARLQTYVFLPSILERTDTPCKNGGMNGSPNKLAWERSVEIVEAVAAQTGWGVVYSNE